MLQRGLGVGVGAKRTAPAQPSLAGWWLVVGLGARSLAGADTGSVRCNAALNAGRVG